MIRRAVLLAALALAQEEPGGGVVLDIGKPSAEFYSRGVAVGFSPDGTMLASSSTDGSVTLWDAATGKELRKLVEPLPADRGDYDYLGRTIESLVFAPGGTLYGAGGHRFGLRGWDPRTGKETLKLSDLTEPLAVSPDGKVLAATRNRDRTWSSNDRLIVLIELETARTTATLAGHRQAITSLDFSPDGKTLASGSQDGTLRLWDLSAAKEIHRVGEERVEQATGPAFPHCVRFSPDGSTLAVSHHGCWTLGLDLIDVKTRKTRASLDIGNSDALVFSPDGKHLACQGKSRIELFDVEQGRRTSVSAVTFPKRVFGMARSPDGGRLAVAGDGGVIRILDPSKFVSPLK